MSKLKVAVLMGGTSSERKISLSTGRQIIAALDPAKYVPVGLDAAALSGRAPDLLPEGAPISVLRSADPADAQRAAPEDALVPMRLADIAATGPEARPDVVFIALHGRGGEDGTVQGLLEVLGIPYTGSGVLASALAMDKAMTKRLLRADGIPVPGDVVVRRCDCPDPAEVAARVSATFGFPAVVKPNAEGSTIGCSIVREPSELAGAIEEALRYDTTVLAEQFVAGTEITAALLGNEEPQVLPLIEIVAKGGFYDYEAKYAPGGSEHIIPARVSELAAERARDYAARCHTLLGCRGMSRVDMIVAGDQPYVLETNTIPGMTPTSLLPDAARAAGIGFRELLDRLIGYALDR